MELPLHGQVGEQAVDVGDPLLVPLVLRHLEGDVEEGVGPGEVALLHGAGGHGGGEGHLDGQHAALHGEGESVLLGLGRQA